MVHTSGAANKMTGIFKCNTPEDTFALGGRFGGELRPGDVVLLYGGLGAGKTLFTKGILQAFDYDVDEVTSPSFSLVNLYKIDDLNIYHIDLWRLDESADAAFAVGLDEMLDEENAIIIIEWPERLGSVALNTKTKKVNITGEGDAARQITFS